MEIAFNLKPLQKFEAKLKHFVAKFPGEMERNKDEHTRLLLEEVKRRASGRPGPNIITGRYLSWFMIMDGKVINPSPQTMRLEFGFIGTDRLGRRYHQPAFPHFRPALEVMRKQYRDSIIPLVKDTWRDTK